MSAMSAVSIAASLPAAPIATAIVEAATDAEREYQ